MTQPGDITVLLRQAERGDAEADNRLYALVVEDLKQIARKRKRSAQARADVSTTELVHDAFLQLVGQGVTTWQPGDRRKFFGYSAKKIHALLIDAARKASAGKRGAGRPQADLDPDALARDFGPTSDGLSFLVDLQEALSRFDQLAPEDAQVFRIRYFLNCTFEECAELLGLSATDAKRGCKRAQLWLQQELKSYDLKM
jgi:RNA polymerase sigma factor (TIGR02999 family)